jgi:kynureninase
MSGADDAQARDADDELATLRDRFHVPPHGDGEATYFAGNSLGLQPKALRARLGQELDEWARLGVEGHLEAARPWVAYHELLREPTARLVGALPAEVVAMNSLTVNLHLLMVSFYRPSAQRFKILIEDSAFPSDSYAVRSQVALHGHDPDAQRGRRRAPAAPRRAARDGAARCGELLQRRVPRHRGDHRGRSRRRCAGRLGPRARDGQRRYPAA